MAVPISARRDGSHIMHCTGPDVCKTPMGSSMVPVPYMSMVTHARAVRTSKTVKNNAKQDYQLNSRSLQVTGHEPGVGKGIKVAGHTAYAHSKKGSKTVYSEGWSVIRHNDPAWINHPNIGPIEPKRNLSRKKVPLLFADKSCAAEWAEARKICRGLIRLSNPPRGLTGGYSDVENCARGFVSARCGGNPL